MICDSIPLLLCNYFKNSFVNVKIVSHIFALNSKPILPILTFSWCIWYVDDLSLHYGNLIKIKFQLPWLSVLSQRKKTRNPNIIHVLTGTKLCCARIGWTSGLWSFYTFLLFDSMCSFSFRSGHLHNPGCKFERQLPQNTLKLKKKQQQANQKKLVLWSGLI